MRAWKGMVMNKSDVEEARRLEGDLEAACSLLDHQIAEIVDLKRQLAAVTADAAAQITDLREKLAAEENETERLEEEGVSLRNAQDELCDEHAVELTDLRAQLAAAQERLGYVPTEEDLQEAAEELAHEDADSWLTEETFKAVRDAKSRGAFTFAAALDALTWERYQELVP